MILYYSILYHIILYYIILNHTIMYHITLHHDLIYLSLFTRNAFSQFDLVLS